MRYLSLCSGIGGLERGADLVNEALGAAAFECVGMSEVEPFCIELLKLRYPDVPQLGAIENVTDELIRRGIGNIGLVAGGIPCQSYSIAGKRLGANDARDLWPPALKIIRHAQPRWVLIENVSGFADHDDGLPRLWHDLENEGFEVGAVEIPACAVGASHERLRTFVVAYADGKGVVPEQSRQPNAEHRSNYAIASGQRPVTLADRQNIGRHTRPGLCGCDERRNGRRLIGDGNGEGSARGVVMADAPREGMERHRAGGFGFTSAPGGQALLGCQCAGSGATDRRSQSGMGRSFDGLPGGLDGFNELIARMMQQQRRPALMGEAQHSWEPPRLAPKGPQWKQRIGALGNAIVPVQVAPVLLAIAMLEELA